MGRATDFLFRAYVFLGKWYLTPILIYEQRQNRRAALNERPLEYEFSLRCLSEICPRDVLDVGSGLTAWPTVLADCGFQVTAIDQGHDYWGRLFFNRHFHIRPEDITRPRQQPGSFDLITCLSVLEHIPDHQAAISGMLRLLRPGGHLILSFPYCEGRYIDNVYNMPGAGYGHGFPFICQVYSREQIDAWFPADRATVVNQEYYRVFSGELWTFGERSRPLRRVSVDQTHQLSCLLVRKNGCSAVAADDC